MKKLLFIILLSFIIHSSYAQSDSTKRNWSLGVSVWPVFNPNTSSANKFLFNIKRSVGNYKIRLNTSFDAYTSSNSQTKGSSYAFGYMLGLGYEKDYYLKNWSVYSGLDLFYQKLQTKNYPGKEKEFYTRNESFSMGLKPFAGFAYRVNSRLSFSSEIGFALSIRNSLDEMNSESVGYSKNENNSADIMLNYSQILNVNYHF